MKQETITSLKSITRSLADIIVDIDPANEAEWDALEILTTAHHSLRKIKYSKISQLPLPEPVDPETDCPDCMGRGSLETNNGITKIHTMCPRCHGVGKVKSQPPLEPVHSVPVDWPTDEASSAPATDAASPQRRGRRARRDTSQSE
jgi:hypothetical protein